MLEKHIYQGSKNAGTAKKPGQELMQKKPNVLYVHAFIALFIKRRRAKS